MTSLDAGVIGTRIPEHSVEVERGRLAFFGFSAGSSSGSCTGAADLRRCWPRPRLRASSDRWAE